jgi:hypothetical protein
MSRVKFRDFLTRWKTLNFLKWARSLIYSGRKHKVMKRMFTINMQDNRKHKVTYFREKVKQLREVSGTSSFRTESVISENSVVLY